jgi:signal transduction histidine kinase/CheY-like chemotaxis protein
MSLRSLAAALFPSRKADAAAGDAGRSRLAELEARCKQAALAATVARKREEELANEVGRLRGVESDLLEAKRNAEAAALTKGEFLATMSHEVRTPLNGILPILELVLSRPLDSETRSQVEAALDSAKEMRRIVNDVLDFSKLEAGALKLEVASLRPGELLQSVCSLMRRSAEAKNLKIVCQIDPAAPGAVRGDALRLRQVITNLMSNAVKFTQHGQVTVTLAQVAEDRTHRTLKFQVQDTGIGIAPEASKLLFQPFSQADASMARTHGGTGLGLAICKKIIESMGGQIGVKSIYGKGSTFWFSVPVLRAAGEAPNVLASDTHALLLSKDDAIRERWTQRLLGVDVRVTPMATAYEVMAALRAALASKGSAGLPQLVVVDLASACRTAASVVRPLLAEEEFAGAKLVLLGTPPEGLALEREEGRMLVFEQDLHEAAAQQAIRTLLAGDKPVRNEEALDISDEANVDFGGLRVLLVDDIAINRYAGQLTLQKLGCRVVLAEGGREAIDHMTRDAFDAVLLDCQMPDIDGFTVARVHRLSEQQHGQPRMPILAVTANAMPGDREKCLAAGMDDHLAKPIDARAVSRMLRRWTRGNGDGGRHAGAIPRLTQGAA